MPITKASGNAVAPAAKGDLVVGSATNDASILSVGTNGQYLTANSSAATGLEWTSLSAGGMTLISRQVPSGATSMTFGSIPGSYNDLLLRWIGIYTSDNATAFDVRLNNDSGNNYQTYYYSENGVSQTTTSNVFNGRFLSRNNGTTSWASNGKGFLKVNNYANTTYRKQLEAVSGFVDTVSGNLWANIQGVYNSASAITSIDIYRTAGTGSMTAISGGYFELWGLK